MYRRGRGGPARVARPLRLVQPLPDGVRQLVADLRTNGRVDSRRIRSPPLQWLNVTGPDTMVIVIVIKDMFSHNFCKYHKQNRISLHSYYSNGTKSYSVSNITWITFLILFLRLLP